LRWFNRTAQCSPVVDGGPVVLPDEEDIFGIVSRGVCGVFIDVDGVSCGTAARDLTRIAA
jgi:hypothetical protein